MENKKQGYEMEFRLSSGKSIGHYEEAYTKKEILSKWIQKLTEAKKAGTLAMIEDDLAVNPDHVTDILIMDPEEKS